MTEQEMNDFLQSIGGLENGMYSNREPIMTAGFFECDEGWYQLIKDLITDLIELGWDKQICQVRKNLVDYVSISMKDQMKCMRV